MTHRAPMGNGLRPQGERDAATAAPELSVLIISHGHSHCLHRCLASLGPALHGVAAEVLLLDNLGGDLLRDMPPLSYPIRYFANHEPAGFAANANRLTREARAPRVLLLNPDTAYAEGALPELLSWLDDHPQAGLVGCRLLNEDNSLQRSCRRFPSPAVFLLRGLGVDRWPWQPKFYRQRMMEGRLPCSPTVVDWVFGAFLLYRRDQYLDLGGMDEGFYLYYEDVDLARRLQKAGLATIYYPPLAFHHIHLRTSARRPLGQTWRWHALSAWRYFMKHGFF